MAYRRTGRPQPRDMVLKYAGNCACCGELIKAGTFATYYPAGSLAGGKAAIGHIGGLEGNSATCAAVLRQQLRDPGFVDLDRMYEDSCSDIVGR